MLHQHTANALMPEAQQIMRRGGTHDAAVQLEVLGYIRTRTAQLQQLGIAAAAARIHNCQTQIGFLI